MSAKATELRDLYLDLAEETTITETQQPDRNRDPLDTSEVEIEDEVTGYRRQNGLEDALEGVESASA